MDPGAAALFGCPLVAYLLTRTIFPQPDTQISSEMMVKTAVEIFLQGMQILVDDNES